MYAGVKSLLRVTLPGAGEAWPQWWTGQGPGAQGVFGLEREEVQKPHSDNARCPVLWWGRPSVGEDVQTQGELAYLAQGTFHQMYKPGAPKILVLGL